MKTQNMNKPKAAGAVGSSVWLGVMRFGKTIYENLCHFLFREAELNPSVTEMVLSNCDNQTRYQCVWTVATVVDSNLRLVRRLVYPRLNPTLGLLPGDRVLKPRSSIVFAILRPFLLVLRMPLFVWRLIS